MVLCPLGGMDAGIERVLRETTEGETAPVPATNRVAVVARTGEFITRRTCRVCRKSESYPVLTAERIEKNRMENVCVYIPVKPRAQRQVPLWTSSLQVPIFEHVVGKWACVELIGSSNQAVPIGHTRMSQAPPVNPL